AKAKSYKSENLSKSKISTNKQSTSNPREPPVEIQAVFCCCGKGKKLTENDSLLGFSLYL
ncbi:hypothetical protein, partial [Mannheimia haemolytica]|uniref:hypothetical protein n=1 Tax=Mannheimia haemolytica TaxID=75985 RepID=UPI001F23F93B